jgi:hypothetical protein
MRQIGLPPGRARQISTGKKKVDLPVDRIGVV